jgi:hypothetical protein
VRVLSVFPERPLHFAPLAARSCVSVFLKWSTEPKREPFGSG